jgi:EmrB/QacA subfamily drug resistance transporter
MLMVTLTIVLVAMPGVQQAMGVGDADRTWMVTAYTLPFGALMLVGGELCQRFGLKRSFLVAAAGFGLASLAGGLAPSFEALIAARAVQGGFAALLAPTNLALVSSSLPDPRSRSRAFAVLGGTGGAGAAAGLFFGGLFTEFLDWRWCLWVNVPIAAVALLVAHRALPGSSAPRPGRILADPGGVVLSGAGLFTLIWSFSSAQRVGWTEPRTILGAAVGSLLLAGFVVWEGRAFEPLLPLSVLKSPARDSSNLVMFFTGWAQLGVLAYLSDYLQDCLGYGPAGTGVAILPLVAALIVLSALSSAWILPRWGIAIVYPLGVAVIAIGFQTLAGLAEAPGYLPRVLPGLLLVGAGMGIVLPPAFAVGTDGVPASQLGVASATLNSAQQLGASFGTAFLATWAIEEVTRSLTAQADAIHTRISLAITTAHLEPDSAAAQQLSAAISAQYRHLATSHAYASGFQIVAIIGYLLAAVLATLNNRRGRTSSAKPMERAS